jgi:hypothetical protein
MAVRLSALRSGRTLTPRRFLVLISVRGWADSGAIVRLEGLGQLRNPMISSAIGPATFRLYHSFSINLRSHVLPVWWVTVLIRLRYCGSSTRIFKTSNAIACHWIWFWASFIQISLSKYIFITCMLTIRAPSPFGLPGECCPTDASTMCYSWAPVTHQTDI